MPAMPAPITMMSVCSKGISAGSSAVSPSPVMAFFTASIIPLEVKVAPATASTSQLWASTIAWGMVSRAGSLMPAVSDWEVTSTAVILPPSTVTDTSIFPIMPLPLPV